MKCLGPCNPIRLVWWNSLDNPVILYCVNERLKKNSKSILIQKKVGLIRGAKRYKCRPYIFRLYTKPKKLITEEKMAEHLQGLHISPDFTAHSTATLEDYSSDSVSMESDSSTSSTDYPFSITTTQDLEQKLRNAQRITICEQIRKLQNEPVIPQVNYRCKIHSNIYDERDDRKIYQFYEHFRRF